MGWFDSLFGKNKKNIEIKDEDSLGDIARKLAQSGVISVPKDDNHNTFGETLDRLEENGELPWGWYHAKSGFIKPRDSKLYELSIKASETESVDDEIKKLEDFIDYYYEYQNECFMMGECYKKYFEDMHMKCHNSRNECFEFVTPKIERLKYLKQNYDKLKQDEQTLSILMATLDSDLFSAIINNPGIVQSELYKKFDPLVKIEISNKLYEWEKVGRIKREKNGRSYSLYVV